MKSALLRSVFGSLVCLLVANSGVRAQGVGASGEITGTVIDPAGAAIPNAKITVSDVDKGVRRTALADSGGLYRMTGLPPSDYRVSAEFSGFQTEVQTGVVVTVGQVVSLDFHLKIAKAEAIVEVSSQAPVVETERSQQSNTVEQQYIEALPINRRDYLTFTLLTPGVSDSTRMADNTDFRVKQTPQSGLSLYGSNGRGNAVTVDGGEYNDNAGGVRLTVSQDAVQEFQVNRSNYSADLGSASGASINIVSKSGSNNLHGSLYGFFRNDALDARDPFAFTQALTPGSAFSSAAKGVPTKDSLQRQQFGGTVGFPIKKDKTFLFGSFEGQRRDEQHAVPLLTDSSIFNPTAKQNALLAQVAAQASVPCFAGRPNIPGAACAAALTSALTVSPTTGLAPINRAINNYIISQLEANGGLFPFNEREYLASARLDHQFSDRNQTFLRFTYGHDSTEDPDVQALTGFSRGSSVIAYDATLQGSWFHQFSARTQNEVRLQGNYNKFSVLSNDPAGPGIDIPGFGTIGGGIFLPAFTIGRRGEAADNLTMIRGHHTMKTGFYGLLRSDHIDSHTFFPGRFVFGSLAGTVLSRCLGASPSGPNGAATPTSPATGPNACGVTTLGVTLNSLQAVSLGAPQFYQQGFDGNVYPTGMLPWVAGYWQDAWQILPNLTLTYGLRYELDKRYQINTDKDNFAPRISFTWDPFKDHKTVVRGGYGIFYAPTYGQIDGVARSLGVLDANKKNVPESQLAQCGTTITCNRQIAQIFVSGAGPAAGNIFKGLLPTIQNCPIGGSQTQTPCITPTLLAPFGIAVTHTGAIPLLSVTFSASPDYQSPRSHQVELGIEREVAKGFSVSVSGIYVHTLDEPRAIDTNILGGTAPTVSAFPFTNGLPFQNWGNFLPNGALSPCAGAGVFNCFAIPRILQTNVYGSTAAALYEGGILEVKKRFSDHFTLFGNYTYSHAWDDTTDFNSDFEASNQALLSAERSLSAFDQRHKVVVAAVFDSPWKGRVLSGFELSPILRYNSARPFNLLAGTNVNNDRHSTNDRPPGAGRNSGVGPDFVTFDTRLSWHYKVREKSDLQFMAEGFNILNRTSYASVNNTVGADFTPPFNVHGSNIGPSQPLGFTSAFLRRQLQLGIRLSF